LNRKLVVRFKPQNDKEVLAEAAHYVARGFSKRLFSL
jgi:hypothetical protein